MSVTSSNLVSRSLDTSAILLALTENPRVVGSNPILPHQWGSSSAW